MALRKELHLFGAPPMAINQTECLDEGATGFLLHVEIDGGPWDAPQNGDLRPRGLVDDDDQTETHGHQNAHQHSQEQSAQEGSDLRNQQFQWTNMGNM